MMRILGPIVLPSPALMTTFNPEIAGRRAVRPQVVREAGADRSRVSFVDNVCESSKTRSFDPATDIEPLREAIKHSEGADLLIIDPIVSAVAGDSHKNTEVRRALQPSADFASGLAAALIGITHFSKATTGRTP
jgi:putative DNA primase/helicase